MKKILLFCFLFSSITLQAQLTSENFEGYTPGTFDGQWIPGTWTGWFGANSNVDISTTQAHSGANSMEVNSSVDDIVALFDTLKEGTYEINFYQYIPFGFGSYYNLQHNYTNTLGDWACEVYFSDNSLNLGRIVTNANTATFIPIYDQWVENKMELNFETAQGKFYYNGVLVQTWNISTNSTGGSGLNQINAMNFYGACDGFSCLTKAFYDDITVVQTAIPAQYDASILTKNSPLPYTHIPDSLMTPMLLSAEVVNYGTLPVTNVQVTFHILDVNDNLLHTEQSNILSFLGGNLSDIVYGNSSYMPANQSETYKITYEVSITETDDNPLNNLDTLLFEVVMTDSVYAKDDGNYNDGLGANGISTIIGQNYEFIEDVFVHSVTTSYIGGSAGNQIRLIVYKNDSITKLPIDDLYTSAVYTLPTNGGGIGSDTYVTFHIAPPIDLDKGLYAFAIEQMSLTAIGISTTPTIFKPETTIASTNGGGTWSFLENFGFEIAMNIRPTISIIPQTPNHTTVVQSLEIFEITPNPTKGELVMNVELSENQEVKIDIFNAKGQMIQSLNKGSIRNLQQRIDLTNESVGIYWLRLTIGNEIVTKQIFKL